MADRRSNPRGPRLGPRLNRGPNGRKRSTVAREEDLRAALRREEDRAKRVNEAAFLRLRAQTEEVAPASIDWAEEVCRAD